MLRNAITGTLVGTGAAQTVPIGWQPDYVEIVNITDGTVVDKWYAGMAAGTSITISSGSVAPRTTNGISLFPGDGTKALGFTVGSAILTNAKTFAYIAQRS